MRTLWLALVFAGTVHAESTEVSLKTQFGDERRILPPETTPVVFVYSDRQGSALARPWLDKLDDAGTAIVEIAHLGDDGRLCRHLSGVLDEIKEAELRTALMECTINDD